MRILVTNPLQVSAQALKDSVLKADISGAGLARLKMLNPHVDFERIAAGTVILLPDEPGVAAEAGSAASGDAFSNLSQDLTRALDSSSAQITARLAQNTAEQKTLVAALKVGDVAKQIAGDPALMQQVKGAADRSAEVARKAAVDLKGLDEARKVLAKDLAVLAKLLG